MSLIKKITNYLKSNVENKEITWTYIINKEDIILKPNIPIENNDYFNMLINSLSLEEFNGEIKIPLSELYELYYDLENDNIEIKDDYKAFNLPDLFQGSILINNKGNFYQDNKVEYIVDFFDDNGYFEQINNSVIYSQIHDKYYVLPINISKFLSELDRYNKYESSDLNLQFARLNKIRKAQEDTKESEVSILLSDRLKNEECPVIIESNILIDIEDDGATSTISPILCKDESLNNQLLTQIYKNDEIQDIYITNDNGTITRFVVENKEALKKLKKYRYTTGEDRLDILSGKGEFFNNTKSNEEDMDEDVSDFDLSLFGPRVNSFGYFKYRPIPGYKSNTSDLNWKDEDYPGIPCGTFDGDSVKIDLNPTHLEIFNNALERTKDDERCVIELNYEGKPFNMILEKHEIKNEIEKIKNSMVKLKEIKSIDDLKVMVDNYEDFQNKEYISHKGRYIEKTTLEEINDRIKYLEERKKRKNLNLLISDNFDDIEYEEKADSTDVLKNAVMPLSLKDGITLFDYQKECLCKLQNLYIASNVNGFLLCDDMGLGKTLQLLSFLAWIKDNEEESLPILIVAPTLLLKNWDSGENTLEEGEIQKFFKENTFKTIHISGEYKKSYNELNKYDIVFTTYDSLGRNEKCFGKIKWNVVICDEAQFVKNPSARRTHVLKAQNANFKIACTATPIENSLIDLWSLVDFCKPGLLGSLSEFKNNYVKRAHDKKAEINDELANKLLNFYIRREKDILPKALKPKNMKIIKTKANSMERQEIKKYNKSNANLNIGSINNMIRYSSILNYVESKNNLKKDDLEYILNNSSKIKLLKNILEDISSKGEKVLIFTNYHKTQQVLIYAIQKWYDIKPILLNGEEKNYKKRYISLNDFKSKRGFNVAILSPLVAGFGVTITEANHVIHYDRMWNPAKEDQATDRAYRIGQDKDVTVYYPMLSFSEDDTKSYNDINKFVEENSIRDLDKELSPEEKLNIIIARKKNLLLNFFLAVNENEENDCEEFKEL